VPNPSLSCDCVCTRKPPPTGRTFGSAPCSGQHRRVDTWQKCSRSTDLPLRLMVTQFVDLFASNSACRDSSRLSATLLRLGDSFRHGVLPLIDHHPGSVFHPSWMTRSICHIQTYLCSRIHPAWIRWPRTMRAPQSLNAPSVPPISAVPFSPKTSTINQKIMLPT
jgi:hypothetical protein